MSFLPAILRRVLHIGDASASAFGTPWPHPPPLIPRLFPNRRLFSFRFSVCTFRGYIQLDGPDQADDIR